MDFHFGLIGYPVKHSLSPWIHEKFLQKAGLSGNYSIIEITPDESLKARLTHLEGQGVDGFNVTVPYKQTVIPYLDEIDPEAKAIGAVNTVVKQGDKWKGYNTDGKGYTRALKNKFPNTFLNKENRILIIGAGGAARGIYYALAQERFHQIDIANRTISSAENIAELCLESTKTAILSLDDARKSMHGYDVIIQTTSIGMKPNQEQSVIPVKAVKPSCIVSDIVYQPLETRFLSEAKKAGASIQYGHTMLLYQAQYAFEIWTNKHVPVDTMDNELQHRLEGR